jgi:hypothetical protein
VHDLISRWPVNRHLMYLLPSNRYSNPNVPKWLQVNSSNRRLGTKLLPYIIIITVAFILQFHFSIIYKVILLLALFFITKGYMM